MPMFPSFRKNKGSKIGEKLQKFLLGEDDEELVAKVKNYTNFASYSADIWGDSSSMQTIGLYREVPQMLRDPIIQSCVETIMETSFQMNDKGKVLWPISSYETIRKELEGFHEQVNMSQQSVTMGNNLIIWGNLPFRHYFDSNGAFTNFTPIPDFTKVIPIMVSGKTLGFMVDNQFCYPYEFTYAQLEFYKNLGGLYRNNFVQFSGAKGGEDIFGEDFQNEFTIAPSYLSTAVRPWKNINIIEDALLLNRMDQSNYYRIFSVLVGGSVYSKSAIRTLNYYRNLFKKVRRVSYNSSGMSSTGAGNEFEIVLPKTDKQGLDVTDVGGTQDIRALKDLDVQYNKLFAALKVQPSQIGFGEEQSNAIGDTNGQSYDKRLAKTCKMLVYSVHKAIKNLDYLYLRSRGYDVSLDDWSYGTVSMSILEDQDRANTVKTAVENLKAISDALAGGLQLADYNKSYLVESMLGQSLSSVGVDVKKLLQIPDGQDQAGSGKDSPPLLASKGLDYKKSYLTSMLDTMEAVKVVSSDFITSARTTLLAGTESSLKMVTSSKASTVLSALALEDGNAYMYSNDTRVDLSGVVGFIKGKTSEIVQDLNKIKSKRYEAMATIDFKSSVLVPMDLNLTLGEYNAGGIRALGTCFINSRDELIITDKYDLATFLNMKKSGLLSCLVSRLYQVP